MKNLYHGSIEDFRKIDITAGRDFKDFGPGFYATPQKRHAESIAKRNMKSYEYRKLSKLKRKVLMPNKTAYRYNLLFDDKNLSDLRVLEFKTADINWLKFIILNRTHSGKVHNYDIVIGPTADSTVGKIMDDYADKLIQSNFNAELSNKVIDMLNVDIYPKQYYFGTEAAISKLRFDRIPREIIHC